jgi:hypothetical protein
MTSLSSVSIKDNQFTDQLLHKLTDLRSHCVNYQCHIIELLLENPNYQRDDIVTIMNVLRHERQTWGNLAGILEIELCAGVWSITKSDFKQNLGDDIPLIEQKMNAESNFLESDVRALLQDLLICKFDSFLKQKKEGG